ncbi:MAG: hypothetical protein WBW31_04515, partial [Candidatus Sulfotelmatobacter sp.]
HFQPGQLVLDRHELLPYLTHLRSSNGGRGYAAIHDYGALSFLRRILPGNTFEKEKDCYDIHPKPIP